MGGKLSQYSVLFTHANFLVQYSYTRRRFLGLETRARQDCRALLGAFPGSLCQTSSALNAAPSVPIVASSTSEGSEIARRRLPVPHELQISQQAAGSRGRQDVVDESMTCCCCTSTYCTARLCVYFPCLLLRCRKLFVLGWVGGDTIDPVNILDGSCICPSALSVRSPDFTNFSPCVRRLCVICPNILDRSCICPFALSVRSPDSVPRYLSVKAATPRTGCFLSHVMLMCC